MCIKLGGDPFFEPSRSASGAVENGEANGECSRQSTEQRKFRIRTTSAGLHGRRGGCGADHGDGDVQDAVKVARQQGRDRVVLLLQGGRGWDEAAARAEQRQLRQPQQPDGKEASADARKCRRPAAKRREEEEREAADEEVAPKKTAKRKPATRSSCSACFRRTSRCPPQSDS